MRISGLLQLKGKAKVSGIWSAIMTQPFPANLSIIHTKEKNRAGKNAIECPLSVVM